MFAENKMVGLSQLAGANQALSGSPVRQSEVGVQLEQCQISLDLLSKIVEELEAKLSPIVRQDKQDKLEQNEEEGQMTDLGRAIKLITKRVKQQHSKILSVLERIEI